MVLNRGCERGFRTHRDQHKAHPQNHPQHLPAPRAIRIAISTPRRFIRYASGPILPLCNHEDRRADDERRQPRKLRCYRKTPTNYVCNIGGFSSAHPDRSSAAPAEPPGAASSHCGVIGLPAARSSTSIFSYVRVLLVAISR